MNNRVGASRSHWQGQSPTPILRLLLITLFAAYALEGAAKPPAKGTKRALIVAITEYAPSTGWPATAAKNDVALVRKALQMHRFADADIHVLRDRQATVEGIVDAFQRYLIEPAGAGDLIVFHFSGHGQQLTDDSDEESDGYDEAIVPYDAPMTPDNDYDGSRHLRDDRLDGLLQSARRRVGPAGNVIVFLDSCFSGTANRGPLPGVRGGPPVGPPRSGSRGGADDGGGVYHAASPGGELAPYVVFSASRADQLDQEAYDPELRRAVGPLSYAMSKALLRLRSEVTYRELFEDIRTGMRQLHVGNDPQLEGNADTLIFSGRAVPQAHFFPIGEVRDGGRRVVLPMGTIGGLVKGAEVEVHRAVARQAAVATRLSRGKVEAADALTATVHLDKRIAPAQLAGARAFVTAYVFGDLKLRVRVVPLGDAALQARIEHAIGGLTVAERVEAGADVTLAAETLGGGRVLIASTEAGSRTFDKLDGAGLERSLAQHLEDLARLRYLARLALDVPSIRYRFDIIPVEVSRCADAARPRRNECTVRELDPQDFRSAGNELRLPVGSYFEIRLYRDADPAYVTLLDLMPDGALRVAWPRSTAGERVSAEHPIVLDFFRVTEPLGLEQFLLVATPAKFDLRPLESRDPKVRDDAKKQKGPFTFLFENLDERTLLPVIPNVAATCSRQIRVVAK